MIFVYIEDHLKDRNGIPSPEFYYKALWGEFCYPCMQLVFMYETVKVGHKRCLISPTEFSNKLIQQMGIVVEVVEVEVVDQQQISSRSSSSSNRLVVVVVVDWKSK